MRLLEGLDSWLANQRERPLAERRGLALRDFALRVALVAFRVLLRVAAAEAVFLVLTLRFCGRALRGRKREHSRLQRVNSPPQPSPFEGRTPEPAITPDQRVASCTSWRTSRASSFIVVMEERSF